ncbi:ATP-binding cassette domain-containing protein [Ohessyouella blattaphilus]|uniref:ABC transporter ATP-binding protein/permease n=2 Tax=Ohessyouella blattaphilus TaxID=2949333 RepID=A0ABT1ELH0_9FIRM|nr:ABC transporter ATP-binding protein [Ohessyouella blattaphilus]MCP1111548.1 ABC transporter ATP-binding protein/permease [Ohessyouella blattaphilus]MCR8564942.1 ABC transporter ATP-binding protein/permease [Ohessyouella blattaphilus]
MTEKGLDAKLGFWFDDGHQISIGEWQRLAIARALIRDADMYVFDEPNASLDMKSEKQIIESFIKNTKEKMSIVITHRPNAMHQSANEILVLENGEIIDRGTYSELIKRKGVYNTLYK